MFTTKRPIDDELEALWGLSTSRERGDLIKYEDIEQATAMAKGDPYFAKLCQRWRKRLLGERKIYALAEHNVGYMLLTHEQQVSRAQQLERRGRRGLALAGAVAGVVDPEKLSQQSRAIQQHLVSSSEKVLQLMNTQRAERKALVSKTESLPRLADA